MRIVQHALLANINHGLRRTNADKRHSIRLALEAWPKQSDNSIAAKCGVHHTTVATVREEQSLSCEISKIEKRTVTRSGTTYTQDTSAIGRKPTKAKSTNGNGKDERRPPSIVSDAMAFVAGAPPG